LSAGKHSTAEHWTVDLSLQFSYDCMQNHGSLATELNWAELYFCSFEANRIETSIANISFVTASIRCSENVLTETLSSNGLFRLSNAMSHSLSQIYVLANRCLAMDYSGFQTPCHTLCHGYVL
jgi:hypothetical protein